MAKLTKNQEAMENLKNELREIFAEHNHQVYTELNHVSKSGMLRLIKVYVKQGNYQRDITNLIAPVIGYSLDNKGRGLRVTGCGMDMGFHVVYSLSTLLYKNEDGSYSRDGAYKLKQRWL